MTRKNNRFQGALTNHRQKSVFVPRNKIGHVVLECVKGLGRDLTRKGLTLDEERVMNFFAARSSALHYEDFTDSSRDWYLTTLDASSHLNDCLKMDDAVIFDIGCGRGGLLQWLLDKGKQAKYVGVDQDWVTIEQSQRRFGPLGTFLRGDVKQLATFLTGPFDIMFAINLFPYLRDPIALLQQCKILARNGDSLLAILDPNPSPYWEKEFGGFGIEVRDATNLKQCANRAGWTLCERVRMATASFFGFPLMTLSNLLIFRPANNSAEAVREQEES